MISRVTIKPADMVRPELGGMHLGEVVAEAVRIRGSDQGTVNQLAHVHKYSQLKILYAATHTQKRDVHKLRTTSLHNYTRITMAPRSIQSSL